MKQENLLLQNKEGVAYITLNSPDTSNALARDLRKNLEKALDLAVMDPAVRVVVIKGSGRYFCVGNDLEKMDQDNMSQDEDDEDLSQKSNSFLYELTPIPLKIATMGKPVIAAVNGYALGAGCSLAMACDLIIAAESASFSIDFSEIGLVPDGGSTFFLPQLIGLLRAKEMAFTGRKVSAAEAERIGLINRTVPDKQFEVEIEQLASSLASGPAVALGITKKLFNRVVIGDLASALEGEAFAQTRWMSLFDKKEG